MPIDLLDLCWYLGRTIQLLNPKNLWWSHGQKSKLNTFIQQIDSHSESSIMSICDNKVRIRGGKSCGSFILELICKVYRAVRNLTLKTKLRFALRPSLPAQMHAMHTGVLLSCTRMYSSWPRNSRTSYSRYGVVMSQKIKLKQGRCLVLSCELWICVALNPW
jgi:hypothetical protein